MEMVLDNVFFHDPCKLQDKNYLERVIGDTVFPLLGGAANPAIPRVGAATNWEVKFHTLCDLQQISLPPYFKRAGAGLTTVRWRLEQAEQGHGCSC